jgi:hypothetical protein
MIKSEQDSVVQHVLVGLHENMELWPSEGVASAQQRVASIEVVPLVVF